MNILLLLNVLGAWFLWKWSAESFERKHDFIGWTMIFFSAWNIAAAADSIL